MRIGEVVKVGRWTVAIEIDRSECPSEKRWRSYAWRMAADLSDALPFDVRIVEPRRDTIAITIEVTEDSDFAKVGTAIADHERIG